MVCNQSSDLFRRNVEEENNAPRINYYLPTMRILAKIIMMMEYYSDYLPMNRESRNELLEELYSKFSIFVENIESDEEMEIVFYLTCSYLDILHRSYTSDIEEINNLSITRQIDKDEYYEQMQELWNMYYCNIVTMFR